MTREDLESKVRVSLGPASPGGRTEMVAALEEKVGMLRELHQEPK